MIFYRDGQWSVSRLKIKYTRNGEEEIKNVGSEGKQWWLDFETKWDDMEIVEFTPVEVTQEQEDRLVEINNLSVPEGRVNIVSDFVMYGMFPIEVEHILRNLQTVKEKQEQDKYLLDLEFRQSLQELGVKL